LSERAGELRTRLRPLAIIRPMRSVKREAQNLGRATVVLPALAVIVVVFLPLSPAYDLDVFLRAGYAALHGLHVYPRPGSSAVYSGFSFVYPYFALWPFVPLVALSPGLSTILFFALCSGAVIAACLVAADDDPWRALLVLCTAFTITGLQLGALSPLLFAGALFLWRVRNRPVAFGLLAAPVVASKLFLAPLLVWLLLARRYRALAWASGSTLALLAIGFALGPLGPASYLGLLSKLGAHEARSGFGLIGCLMNAGLEPGMAEGAAAALAAALFSAAYVHSRRAGDERVLFCAGIVASLVLTPVLWSHYLVLLPAALLALNAPRRWFVMVALASWAIAPPHGVHLESDLIEDVASSGSWLAVATSMLVFGYSVRAPRERLARTPDSSITVA
jgi:alpha-1,2-mannosyltransferase